MQAAVNRLYKAPWPALQDAGSPSPNLHPRSVLVCAPEACGASEEATARVVYLYEDRQLTVDRKRQQAAHIPPKNHENLKHAVSTALPGVLRCASAHVGLADLSCGQQQPSHGPG